jgi:hypothetical protein
VQQQTGVFQHHHTDWKAALVLVSCAFDVLLLYFTSSEHQLRFVCLLLLHASLIKLKNILRTGCQASEILLCVGMAASLAVLGNV